MTESVVRNVSDTARWTAYVRAQESARPDALFVDPLAERLAGDRGKAIIAKLPRFAAGNGAAVTTKLFDELIEQSIAEGCDRVINLAAGLDARPYRLELPSELEWIEADLPGLIEEKNELLESETPRCRLSRIPVDLIDAHARSEFLAQATAGAEKVMVITEGFLSYLTEDAVESLARDLAQLRISRWVTDLMSSAVLRKNRRFGKLLENSPMQFGPATGLEFFRQAGGWAAADIRSPLKAGVEWKRFPLVARMFAGLYRADPRKSPKGSWIAIMRLTLSDVAGAGDSVAGSETSGSPSAV